MSDNDDDSLPHNEFRFQNDNTIISARGPTMNNTTGLSFRNNALTSTMHMPAYSERQMYGSSNFDHRSMCHRRETSPMSSRSVPAYGLPAFSRYPNQNGICFQQSIISARGPTMNNTTGLSFQNNVLTSTMHMPAYSERQMYGSSNFDHRSMCHRRETSPMSSRSVPAYGPPAFSRFPNQNEICFQQSMNNGRGRSPMSVRSIDSTASLSAADIAFAFRNVKFNKNELRIIKDAYNKSIIKTRQRRRIEKRRNQKLFFKGTRRKSEEDSGEQGSDSSISSDDCRSVKTTICKENIPRQKSYVSHFNTNMRGGSNYLTKVSHHSTNMQEMSIDVIDCTDNIKNNTLRNMMSNSSDDSKSKGTTKGKFLNTIVSQDRNPSTSKVQNVSIITQKERFKKGFLLPSQRFNKTNSDQTRENNNKYTEESETNKVALTKPSQSESDCEPEDIFRGFSINEKYVPNVQRKRSLETQDSFYSKMKRNKLESLKNQSDKPSEPTHNNIPNGKSNDFIFAKPQLPVKKGNTKNKISPEKLLAKSGVPPIADDIELNFAHNNKKGIEEENVKDIEDHTQSNSLHSSSDISMRPSFMKRKLFTQKLHMAEHKNASSDSLNLNSPQNIYSASVSERNKARKLVTSQSCLSREVQDEDNNVLDLIHKIVPPDQINVTNVASRTEACNNKANDDTNNKWDVTAVIANCDNQDISDTYTDEEIFNVNDDKNSEKSKKSIQVSNRELQPKVNVQKLSPQILKKLINNNNNNELPVKTVDKVTRKESVTGCVTSFWDTDLESDMEFNVAPSRKSPIKQNREVVLPKRINGIGDKQSRNDKKPPTSKGTILTVRNCHKDSILNNSIKSHKSNPIKPDSVVHGKDIKVGKNNKDTNSTSQTGKKEYPVNDNYLVKNKKEEAARKPKAKQCADCIQEPERTTKMASRSKNDDKLDDKRHVPKNTLNNGNSSVKATVKSKKWKSSESKQANNGPTNKVDKLDQKNNTKKRKESANNGKIQQKRKSENSLDKSSKIPNTSTTITPNKRPKTKSAKKSISSNTSVDSISTIITRSRSKQSFNSSQNDYSSMNHSNISNRSLRLRQRIQRNRN